MADVDDAGQIVLVTALVLAATFIGLALVLNTVIFTENVATRQTSAELDRSQEYQGALNQSTTDALATVNENPVNSSHATLRANLSETLTDKMVIYQRDATIGGSSVEIAVDDATGGFLLKQTDPSRDFTAGGTNAGDTDWALATASTGTRAFQMNVSRKSLFEATVDTTFATLADNAFHVTVENDTTTWEVYFYQDPLTNNVHVIADDPDTPLASGVLANQLLGSCSYSDDFIRVDFEEGTVNGNECEELSFYDEIDGQYSISYNNTETTVGGTTYDRAAGTYQLRVTNTSAATSNFHSVASGSSPYKVTAITDAQVRLEHETSHTEYLARLDVSAPSFGLYGSTGVRPSVTIDDVVDNTDSDDDYDFTVTASASDPNGNLDRMEFVLTDEEGREVESTNVSVSGGSATETVQFQKDDGLLDLIYDDDGNFTIQVTAYDGQGLSATVAETHKADGDGSTDGDEVYPSYDGAEVPAADGQAGGTGADLARATPTPAEEPVTDAVTETTNTTVVPESTVNETTNATDTTDVEGDL